MTHDKQPSPCVQTPIGVDLARLRRVSTLLVGGGPCALALLLRVLHPGLADLWSEEEHQRQRGRRENMRAEEEEEEGEDTSDEKRNGNPDTFSCDGDCCEGTGMPMWQRSSIPGMTAQEIRDSILVVDPHESYCGAWQRNFHALKIQQLRSMILAHPCPIDPQSLRSFAATSGRSDEVVPLLAAQDMAQVTQKQKQRATSKAKRKAEARRLREQSTSDSSNASTMPNMNVPTSYEYHRVTQSGHIWPRSSLYDLAVPSSALFRSFCRQRVKEWRLDELKVNAKVEQITRVSFNSSLWYLVRLSTGESILAWSVLSCVGNSVPRLPQWAVDWRQHQLDGSISESGPLFHSSELIRRCFEVPPHEPNGVWTPRSRPVCLSSHLPRSPSIGRVLVVGGGLTSAQMVALIAADSQCSYRVDWVQRGYTRVKTFDVDFEWVSPQCSNGCMARFHSLTTPTEKMRAIRAARQGGSITQEMKVEMDRLIQAGQVCSREHTEVHAVKWIPASTDGAGDGGPYWSVELKQTLPIERTRIERYDAILMCTGSIPDVNRIEYLKSILAQHRVDQSTGLPLIDAQLQWLKSTKEMDMHESKSNGSHTSSLSPSPSLGDVASSASTAPSDVVVDAADVGSRFHFLGGFGCLQLGPDAFNLMGARAGSRNLFTIVREYIKTNQGKGKQQQQQRPTIDKSIKEPHSIASSPSATVVPSALVVDSVVPSSSPLSPPRLCSPRPSVCSPVPLRSNSSSHRNQLTRGLKCLNCNIGKGDADTDHPYKGKGNPYAQLEQEEEEEEKDEHEEDSISIRSSMLTSPLPLMQP